MECYCEGNFLKSMSEYVCAYARVHVLKNQAKTMGNF